MNRQTREIGLLAIALLVLGFSLFTMLRRSAPPAPKQQPKPTTQADRQARKEAKTEANEEESGTPVKAKVRNPFAAPPGAAPAEGAPPTAPQPAENPPAAEGASGTAEGGEAAPEGEQEPTIRLSGIVVGQPSVAVIYQGDQRRYARVGDQIGDYRVQSIEHQEVVLVGPTGKLILRMGGRQ